MSDRGEGGRRVRVSSRVARLTLAQFVIAAGVGITLLVVVLFAAYLESSRRSINAEAAKQRSAAAKLVATRVEGDFSAATGAAVAIENDLRFGAASASGPLSLEPVLFAAVLNDARFAEMTLTHGEALGHDPAGDLELAQNDRWQLSVFRASPGEGSVIRTRVTKRTDDGFVAEVRDRTAPDAAFRREGVVDDPTAHLTFRTTASETNYGSPIWTDLRPSDLDVLLPEEQQRIVVTVQKTIEDLRDDKPHFVGVLRVGLIAQTLDEVSRWKVNEADPNDPHRIFISDDQGRLITRLSPSDRYEVLGGDRRIAPRDLPPEIAIALASPALRSVTSREPEQTAPVVVSGAPYFVTFRALAGGQDWRVGIVVPEAYYTRDLRALRNRFLLASLIVGALVLVFGVLTLRALRRALARIVGTTTRMRSFDFAAAEGRAPFRDVQEVMDGLERAKTVVRALGKYVPIDLVRELYESNKDPAPGGELRDVSLMFTDIEGFTGLSERISPDALARALGCYLEAMTTPIQETRGTIDKFIGDAVMAIWNAPSPVADHPIRACEAALGCIEKTRALYASPEWEGLPPLFTRFGLHRATVMVGHFGSPARLSYTALGDGVNLAARLEGLCKQYGIAILASETVVAATRESFQFRLVDFVAVKGKQTAVKVYELLGAVGASIPNLAVARRYEVAFEAYARRDFARAMEILKAQVEDTPSGVLFARCEHLLAEPPPADWDGVFVASSK